MQEQPGNEHPEFEKQELDAPVSTIPRLNIWLLEKKRIWFNLVLGAVALFPLFAELFAGSRYRSKRKILSDFLFDVAPYLVKLFIIYNLVFSIIYLFERSEIKRKGQLMPRQKRNQVFAVLLCLCLFHLVLLYTGKL